MLKVEEQWVEVFTVCFLVLGFMISILLQNRILSYLSVLIAGLLAGRIYYTKRFAEPILPFILIILGFLLGYFIGAVWVSRLWTAGLFLAAFFLSYWLHLKKIIVIFKSEGFLR